MRRFKTVSKPTRLKSTICQTIDERNRLLQEGTEHLCILILDSDRKIAYYSQGVMRLLGYRDSQMMGARLSKLCCADIPAVRIMEKELERAAQETASNYDCELIRKDGVRVPVNVFIKALRGSSGVLRAFAVTLQDIRHYRELQQALRRTTYQKTKLFATLAHELRNPLAPLCDLVDMLVQRQEKTQIKDEIAIMDRQAAPLGQ
jgi:PAS domain S-box-containing protein